MNDSLFLKFIKSWATTEGGAESTDQILHWIQERNEVVHVSIEKIPFSYDGFWFYDEQRGEIRNRKDTFFSVIGLNVQNSDGMEFEQPVILQDEIGYLGIICCEIDGILHFLMQAKIEPGNINKVQISPTIQATKSNFSKSHGGAAPAYLNYFVHAREDQIIVDQIQSEQSSRFYKKRNRNLILMLDEIPKVLPSHKWMTLGQIKALMRYDNLVNMDTRTVLSCIPFSMWSNLADQISKVETMVQDWALLRSLAEKPCLNPLPKIYSYINNRKMFDKPKSRLLPLHKLNSWEFRDGEFIQMDGKGLFKIIYCQIEIEGREIRRWEQPLFEATGIATFGLITFMRHGVRKFIVCAREEVGAFDQIELGPTVQQEAGNTFSDTKIERLFWDALETAPDSIVVDVLLSEEGGRFYHEQNRNLILELPEESIGIIDAPYFEVDFYTLNLLTQVNNCLNIQLRNLVSLLEV